MSQCRFRFSVRIPAADFHRDRRSISGLRFFGQTAKVALSVTAASSAASAVFSESSGDLLPELNSADLAMSLSPKPHHHHHHNHHAAHTTPFSVTDILSPIEEYRKLELCGSPSPYHRSSTAGSTGGSASGSPGAMSGGGGNNNGPGVAPAATSWHVHPQFPAPPPPPPQYCQPDMVTSYGNSATWYGAPANDPRFASRLILYNAGIGILFDFIRLREAR